jgi:hypothetical protein
LLFVFVFFLLNSSPVYGSTREGKDQPVGK